MSGADSPLSSTDRREPWWLTADYGEDPRLVGEDPDGRLWVARRRERQPGTPWTLRFRRRDPRCWAAWFRSWRRRQMTWLDHV